MAETLSRGQAWGRPYGAKAQHVWLDGAETSVCGKWKVTQIRPLGNVTDAPDRYGARICGGCAAIGDEETGGGSFDRG